MWKLKVLIQFVLAALPGGEYLNYRLQKLNGSYKSERINQRILALCEVIAGIDKYKKVKGCVVFELGTGWNAINPLVFYLMGASVCHTYDQFPHARYELARQVLDLMEECVERIHSLTAIPEMVLSERIANLKYETDLGMLFEKAGIIYHAPSDATRTELANGSVDIIYSTAVLEHIPESVIRDFTIESKRILRHGGIAYHQISLADHYASVDPKISSVNCLKYSAWLWDIFVSNRISYVNRLRERQYFDIFETAGAKIIWKKSNIDPDAIAFLKTNKIDKQFSGMTHEQLAVTRSEVILTF